MKPIDMIDERNVEMEKPPQTQEDIKLAQRVQVLFRDAYDAKSQLGLNKKWPVFDDYKHGRQNPKQSEEHPGSVTNVIHPIIESQIADLVDNPYSVESEGEELSDQLFAEQAKHQMEYVLHRNKFKQKVNISEHDRLELGTTIIKTYTDEDALDGRGLPTFEVISPANFFPDPKWSASHRLQECEFNIHAVPRPLSWIRKKFPKMGKYVQRETSVPYDPQEFTHDKSDEVNPSTSQKALLIECYMKDEDGELYCLHVANYILLEDSRDVMQGEVSFDGEPKKLQRRDKFPFVAIPCYTQRGIGWGQGDVELLIPTQDLINDLDDQIRTNARLMGNPQIVFGFVGAGKGFDVRKWTSKAGLRIPMRDHNAYSVVQGQPVSPDVPIRREKAFEEADRISGRSDVTRGERPGGGVTAASAIIALQQAGQKTVLHKAEMFKEGWSQVLELLYDEMLEYWDEEMWIRVQGEEPDYQFVNPSALRNIPEVIPNDNATGDDDRLTELMDFEDIIDEETAEPVMFDIDSGEVALEESENTMPAQREITVTREAQFDFRLSMGNGLPNDKAFIYQTLVELAAVVVEGRHVITWEEMREYLREQVGLPLESTEELERKMQEQQAQQPMQQGMPQGQQMPQDTQGTGMPPNNPMTQIGGMPNVG